MKKFLFLLLFLLLPVVSANLIVIPTANSNSVYKGETSSFQLYLQNNNSFSISNISFTNNSFFSFPVVSFLDAGEVRNITYVVKTDGVFDSVFVSTVSYIYSINYTSTPRVFQVNITSGGFVPNNLSIMQNDSVLWQSQVSQDLNIKDLSSGFSELLVPSLSNLLVNYSGVANFVFYNQQLGYTGNLNIIPRSNVVFAHDSSNDVPVTFVVHSVLNPSVLSLNILTSNISSNNNQSQFGAVEVKNSENVPLYNVSLSAQWSVFSDNNFDLPALGNRLVTFNITPFVSRTRDTNKSYDVVMYARSNNAGNVSKSFSVFVNYANLDVVTINGTTYTINVLGINDTISACIQHFGEAGFESCKSLQDAFAKNITVIKEIPASHQITEQRLLDIEKSSSEVGLVNIRTENNINRVIDYVNNVLGKVENNSVDIKNLTLRQNSFEIATNKKIGDSNTRWVVTIICISAIVLFLSISRLMMYFEEFNLKVASLQE